MPNYSKKIVYLSKEQYQELITNNSVTVNGVTVNYNENDIYVTPQAEPITDIKINNTSIGSNGIANIPVASPSALGVVKINTTYGIGLYDNALIVNNATAEEVKAGNISTKPISPYHQHEAVYYGLSKAAGVSLASETVTVGTYPNRSKAAIQNMLGITDLFSTEETSTATAAHTINSTFMMDGKLYRATAAIAIGDAVVVGTNCEVVKADSIFVKNTDYATTSTAGIIKVGARLEINTNNELLVRLASEGNVKTGASLSVVLTPARIDSAAFYGLSKVAGVDLANETVTLGVYPETSKTAINTLIGSISKENLDNAGITAKTYTTKFGGEFTVTTVTDQDYISPHALASVTGRIAKEYTYRVTFNGTVYELSQRMWFFFENGGFKVYEYLGNLNLYVSNINGVANGTDNVPFIIISDLNDSGSIDVLTEAAGTYTIKIEQINYTKTKLPNSLIYGNEYVPFEKVINSGSTYDGFSIGINSFLNKRGPIALGYCNIMRNQFTTGIGLSNDVAGNDSVAIGYKNTLTDSGLAIGTTNNVSGANAVAIGLDLTANGSGMVALGAHNYPANTSFPNFQANTAYKRGDIVVGKWLSIMPNMVWICTTTHVSANVTYLSNDVDENQIAYWSLAPSTGDTLLAVGNGTNVQNSNAMKIDIVGNVFIGGDIYTNCNNDSTGGIMLPTDVQINGTSIISNGVANVPKASANDLGVIKVASNDFGTAINGDGVLYLNTASEAQVKAGTNQYRPLTPVRQASAVFYGLASVAGDSTQASSDNAVGTYTTDAKSAIQTMLGAQAAIEVIRL